MGAASKPFGPLLACMSIVVGLLASGAAVARTPNGVSFPPSMTVNGTTLTLNGTGTRTVSYFVDAYASALYLRSPAHTLRAVLAERDPKVLVTRYLRDATVPQTIAEYKSLHDKFCSANPCSPPSAASFQRVLDAVTPNSVGDSSTDVVDNGTLTDQPERQGRADVARSHLCEGLHRDRRRSLVTHGRVSRRAARQPVTPAPAGALYGSNNPENNVDP